MAGDGCNGGGGGDTQVLDGGTPPLGEFSLFIDSTFFKSIFAPGLRKGADFGR